MKPMLLGFLLLPCITWAQKKWKQLKPVDDTAYVTELLVYHMECTSCSDAQIDSGVVRVPPAVSEAQTSNPTMGSFSTVSFSESPVFEKLFGKKALNYTKLVWIRCKVLRLLPPAKALPAYTPVVEVYAYRDAGVKAYNTFE
jgi:hypothetical protein